MKPGTCAMLVLAVMMMVLLLSVTAQPDFTIQAQPSFQPQLIEPSPTTRIIVKTNGQTLPGQVVSDSMRMSVLELDSVSDEDAKLSQLSKSPGGTRVHVLRRYSDMHSAPTPPYPFPGVEYAVTDTILWAAAVAPLINEVLPNDPDFRYQWALPRVGAPEAWKSLANHSTSGSKVTVCVADSGVDATHPDLALNLHPIIGYNAVAKDNDLTDELRHGTHIAGILAAVTNNSMGVTGVGSNKVRIIPSEDCQPHTSRKCDLSNAVHIIPQIEVLSCKFLNDDGYGYSSDAIHCIDYCLSMGADIISNSYSGSDPNPALKEAIEAAAEKGVLFVAAAGNTASDLNKESAYPASYSGQVPNMLVVASTNYDNDISSFSNYGNSIVDLGAPGEWILSTVPSNDTEYFSGTSMAAPLVAGAAALVMNASNNTLSAAQVKEILMNATEMLPALQGKTISGGILRIDRAVQLALQENVGTATLALRGEPQEPQAVQQVPRRMYAR